MLGPLRGRGSYSDRIARGWFVVGGVLGIAADLDAGTLHCTTGRGWTPSLNSDLRPGPAVGGALYPALDVSRDTAVRVNLGGDASRPFRHTPPTGEYKPFAAAADDVDVRPPPACACAERLGPAAMWASRGRRIFHVRAHTP